MLSEEAASQIARFKPRRHRPEVVAFARDVVTLAEPGSATRAKALLFAAGKLAEFALSIGLELDYKVVLKDSVIERFVVSPGAGSSATARTVRCNLRAIQRRCLGSPATLALSRERAKAPYSVSELERYLALADAQPTRLRRERASALICLGAGAGLIGGELRRVRGTDVVSRSGGVLVLVGGCWRPRCLHMSRQRSVCTARQAFVTMAVLSQRLWP